MRTSATTKSVKTIKTVETVNAVKTVRQTRAYRCWFEAMLNRTAKSIVASRIERLQVGLYGDVKPCGEGVSELRIDVGPGYRIYFSETQSHAILLLLIGGDKSTQKKDIKDAKKMLSEMKQQRASLHPADNVAVLAYQPQSLSKGTGHE